MRDHKDVDIVVGKNSKIKLKVNFVVVYVDYKIEEKMGNFLYRVVIELNGRGNILVHNYEIGKNILNKKGYIHNFFGVKMDMDKLGLDNLLKGESY